MQLHWCSTKQPNVMTVHNQTARIIQTMCQRLTNTYPLSPYSTACYGRWWQRLQRTGRRRNCGCRPRRYLASGDHISSNVPFPRLRSRANSRTTAYRRRRRVSGPWEPLSFTRASFAAQRNSTRPWRRCTWYVEPNR